MGYKLFLIHRHVVLSFVVHVLTEGRCVDVIHRGGRRRGWRGRCFLDIFIFVLHCRVNVGLLAQLLGFVARVCILITQACDVAHVATVCFAVTADVGMAF